MTDVQEQIVDRIMRAFDKNDWKAWTRVVGGYRFDIPGVGRLYALNLTNQNQPMKLWFELADCENATPTRYLVTKISNADGLILTLKCSWDLQVLIAPREGCE